MAHFLRFCYNSLTMSGTIALNGTTSIDLPTLLDTRLLLLANSGGGKSWALRRILEQSSNQVQQIIIDSEGEFASLREHGDYLLAGADGDIPLSAENAGLLARKLLELNTSAILDLSELHYHERKHVVKLFLDSMIHAPKDLWHPCLVVLDEAQKYCPEQEPAESSNAVIDLATLGRKRGYCLILATQRISKLKKDAAAECNNKLIGRLTQDVDIKRASAELGFTTKERSVSLRTLTPGEFFAFGPAISEDVTRVKIGDVITTHPRAGSRILTSSPIPPTDRVKGILAKLHTLPQQAQEEARTIESLQQQVRSLKDQLRQTKQIPAQVLPPSKEQIQTAVRAAIKKLDQAHQEEIQFLQEKTATFTKVLQSVSSQITDTLGAQPLVPSAIKEVAKPSTESTSQEITGQVSTSPAQSARPAQPERKQTQRTGKERMLDILASRHPMQFTRRQLATLAHLSHRSGTYAKYLLQLRTDGLIAITDTMISLTDKGMAEHHVDTASLPQDPIGVWSRTLTGGELRIFTLLTTIYPQALSKEQLADKTNLSQRSGTFSGYLSHLRHNGLIDVSHGQIRAAEILF